MSNHKWVAQGEWLHCTSCVHKHGQHFPGKTIVITKEGDVAFE